MLFRCCEKMEWFCGESGELSEYGRERKRGWAMGLRAVPYPLRCRFPPEAQDVRGTRRQRGGIRPQAAVGNGRHVRKSGMGRMEKAEDSGGKRERQVTGGAKRGAGRRSFLLIRYSSALRGIPLCFSKWGAPCFAGAFVALRVRENGLLCGRRRKREAS